MSDGRLRIGVSACIMHADPKRNLFKGKTLLYAEESMFAWIMAAGALPVMLPRASGVVTARDVIEGLRIDGLLLQGGADMAPESYGEAPARPEWSGDRARDVYEIELTSLCMTADKPVLGACRGAQVLNVALGGSLWQDIETQHPAGRVHRDWEVYDEHAHDVAIEPGSTLARWHGGVARGRVNSVHHQGLKELGHDLVVEARSVPDGVIEAVRYTGGPFAYGVQWHPEFLATSPRFAGGAGETSGAQEASGAGATTGSIPFLDPGVLMRAFLEEVKKRRP